MLVRAPKTFQDQTLFPEFEALADELDTHLAELTDRVIRDAIHSDVSEAAEGCEPKALPAVTSSASHATSEGTAARSGSADGSPT